MFLFNNTRKSFCLIFCLVYFYFLKDFLKIYKIVESENQGEFEKYKCKLEKRCNKRIIIWQETLAEEKSKEQTKKLKDIDNKRNGIKECKEKIKKLKSARIKSKFLNKLLCLKMK